MTDHITPDGVVFSQHRSVSFRDFTYGMSDEALIRRTNFADLCKLRRWSAKDLPGVMKFGRYSYWHDLLDGNKSFGEKAARKIEEALNLPRGWLDSPAVNAANQQQPTPPKGGDSKSDKLPQDAALRIDHVLSDILSPEELDAVAKDWESLSPEDREVERRKIRVWAAELGLLVAQKKASGTVDEKLARFIASRIDIHDLQGIADASSISGNKFGGVQGGKSDRPSRRTPRSDKAG